jgi:hypothetical protein
LERKVVLGPISWFKWCYIKDFLLSRNRELGRKHGVEYAEAFHYIGPGAPPPVEDYVRKNVVPVGG